CTLPSTFLLSLTHLFSHLIFPLSLHDALPISDAPRQSCFGNCKGVSTLKPLLSSTFAIRWRLFESSFGRPVPYPTGYGTGRPKLDRKSTRLNSSHVKISYAVFCLKKKI